MKKYNFKFLIRRVLFLLFINGTFSSADSMDMVLTGSKVVALPATLVFCVAGSKLDVYKMSRDQNPTCPNGWEVAGFILITYLSKLLHDRVDADTSLRELAQAAKRENSKAEKILHLNLANNVGGAMDELKRFFPKAQIEEEDVYSAKNLKETLSKLTEAQKKFDIIVVSTHGTGEFGDASRRSPLVPEEVGRHDVLKDNGFLLWLGCGGLRECSLDELRESASMLSHKDEVKVIGSQYIVETGAGEWEETKVGRGWYYVATPIAYIADAIYSNLNVLQYGGTGVRRGLGATIKRTLSLKGCRTQLAKP